MLAIPTEDDLRTAESQVTVTVIEPRT